MPHELASLAVEATPASFVRVRNRYSVAHDHCYPRRRHPAPMSDVNSENFPLQSSGALGMCSLALVKVRQRGKRSGARPEHHGMVGVTLLARVCPAGIARHPEPAAAAKRPAHGTCWGACTHDCLPAARDPSTLAAARRVWCAVPLAPRCPSHPQPVTGLLRVQTTRSPRSRHRAWRVWRTS